MLNEKMSLNSSSFLLLTYVKDDFVPFKMWKILMCTFPIVCLLSLQFSIVMFMLQ